MTNKYHNKPTTVDNIRFASIAESKRYHELKSMLDTGIIVDLELQPRYKLVVKEHKICTYVADFRYKIVESGVMVVEDVKGVITQAYAIKRELMKAIHGIDIVEINYNRR